MSGGEPDWDIPLFYQKLEDAVTALAFEGHPDAPGEALRRLCEGEWRANGQWQWKAWAGAIFKATEVGTIPAARWIGLRDALARGLDAFSMGPPLPTFANLYSCKHEIPTREMADWSWYFNRFETALFIQPDREEWFYAAAIEVCEMPPIMTFRAPPTIEAPNKGGRPPKWDWIEATLAMAGRYHLGDLKPANAADVVRALQEWASSGGMDDLPDSTARPYATRILEAFRNWEKAD